MRKAVIFDMDGVLVDSQPFHFDVDYQVLMRAGANAAPEQTHAYAGMANMDRWRKYKRDFNLGQEPEELVRLHVATIMELLDEAALLPIPGVGALIDALRRMGLKTAVASSSSYDFIYKVLDKIGLNAARCFDSIISGEDMKNSKPAPDIFLAAASRLNLEPADCVIIEDSANGVAAAVAAGIHCVGYLNPSSGNQDISAANMIIDDFHVLINNPDWI